MSACSQHKPDSTDMPAAIQSELSNLQFEAKSKDHPTTGLSLDFGIALRQAVATNTSYKSAVALERSMSSKIKTAESVQKLQISGNSTVGGIRETGGRSVDKTEKGAAVGVSLSQLIYDGGLSSSNVNQAAAQAFGASAERKSLGNDLAMEAAKAWIDYWQFQTRISILGERTSKMDDLIIKMERMANNGMIDRSALDSARRQILDISLEEKLLKNNLDAADISFKRFFNQTVVKVAKPGELVGLEEARAQVGSWREAPHLQKIAAEVVIAINGVKAAKAAFQPKAKLQAGVNSPMQEGESTDTSIGIVFEYSFNDGGRRDAQLKEAEARVEAAKARLDDAQKVLSAEIDTAINKLNSLQASLPLIGEKIALSKVEVETARSQLSTGQSDLSQLIDAELENYRAEDRRIALEAEKLILQLLIAAKTGVLGNLIGLENL